jgi:hypothetical protein
MTSLPPGLQLTIVLVAQPGGGYEILLTAHGIAGEWQVEVGPGTGMAVVHLLAKPTAPAAQVIDIPVRRELPLAKALAALDAEGEARVTFDVDVDAA